MITTSPNLVARESFLETLDIAQGQFDKHGIEYRIIGSVAASAYLEADEDCSLNFNRPEARTAYQRVPDIDLIVPRSAVPYMKTVRRELLTQQQPVKLGLVFSQSTIDYRPQEAWSYLNHGSTTLPIDSQLFVATKKELLGVSITTLSPQTLLHTYGTFGGKLRHKDFQTVVGLARLARSMPQYEYNEADYHNFHLIFRDRQRLPTIPERIDYSTIGYLCDRQPSKKVAEITRHWAGSIARRLNLC